MQVITINILGMLRLKYQHNHEKNHHTGPTKYCTGLQIKGLITKYAYLLPLEYHNNIHDWSPENNWTGLSLSLDS